MIANSQTTYGFGSASLISSGGGKYFLRALAGSSFYLGDASVSSSNGYQFPASTALEIELTDSDQLYIVGAGTLFLLKVS